MKHLITLCMAVILLTVGCAKDNPAAIPNLTPAPEITVLAPAIAWWDISDSLFTIQVNKRGSVIADTASLWVTPFAGGLPGTPEYFGYKSSTWTWFYADPTCKYEYTDSVKLQLTYWFSAGPKSTIDMMTVVRVGNK